MNIGVSHLADGSLLIEVTYKNNALRDDTWYRRYAVVPSAGGLMMLTTPERARSEDRLE